MSKVRALTPAKLKRIIAEEKQKIKNQLKRRRKAKKVKRKPSISNDLANLEMLKKAEIKSATKFKKIYEARKLIKKRLLRRL